MTNHNVKAKIIESIQYTSIRKVNSSFLRFILLPEIQLSVRYSITWVSKRLTRVIANNSYRLGMHEKFFCFECGMNFTKGEMRQTIGDWFGVCRWCIEGYNFTSKDEATIL
jgi:hypothetical protein